MGDRHAYSLTETTLTRAEEARIAAPTPHNHRPEPGGGLQGPDQDGAPQLADDVQASVDPVGPAHVGMPSWTDIAAFRRVGSQMLCYAQLSIV